MDMRGHTGGVMSLKRGMVSHRSTKQNLNTKNSTESEVIGASDYMLCKDRENDDRDRQCVTIISASYIKYQESLFLFDHLRDVTFLL